jgi:hypothetical protein
LLACAAIWLFIIDAPLPPWHKAMFVFCGLPVYEYSVMARNYGVSMLLFFLFSSMYMFRKKNPILLSLILALLSNTNIHSLMLSCLLMSLWTWDTIVEGRDSLFDAGIAKVYGALVIFIFGLAVALYTVWPTDQMIVSDPHNYTLYNVFHALIVALIKPSKDFSHLFPTFVPSTLASAVLLGCIFGLIRRPPLLVIAFSGLCSLSVFFSLIYPSGYRHHGLLVVFFISIFGILYKEQTPVIQNKYVQRISAIAMNGAVPAFLACLIMTGASKVHSDLMYQLSASEAFHGFLTSRPEYGDAILISEPDYIIESVRYYTDNAMFIVRENRFGNTIRFVSSAKSHLTLGELLCAGWHIQKENGRPVLIALGHFTADGVPWNMQSPGSLRYSYRRAFSWSLQDLAYWQAYTTLQEKFVDRIIGDEKYAVYSIRTPSSDKGEKCSPPVITSQASLRNDFGFNP